MKHNKLHKIEAHKVEHYFYIIIYPKGEIFTDIPHEKAASFVENDKASSSKSLHELQAFARMFIRRHKLLAGVICDDTENCNVYTREGNHILHKRRVAFRDGFVIKIVYTIKPIKKEE